MHNQTTSAIDFVYYSLSASLFAWTITYMYIIRRVVLAASRVIGEDKLPEGLVVAAKYRLLLFGITIVFVIVGILSSKHIYFRKPLVFFILTFLSFIVFGLFIVFLITPILYLGESL